MLSQRRLAAAPFRGLAWAMDWQARPAAGRGAWGGVVPQSGAHQPALGGLHMMWVRENSYHERGMQEWLQKAQPLGVDHIQAVHRRVQPDTEFHFPAHTGAICHLLRANPG
jgi:hypothetical protein